MCREEEDKGPLEYRRPLGAGRPMIRATEDLLGDDGRLACKVKALAATQVLARHHVVFAHHVRPEFREAGAVTIVSAAGKLTLFGAHDPGDFVVCRLVTVGAIQRSWFLLLLLVEKVTFFHN